jgi:hypothetical protein
MIEYDEHVGDEFRIHHDHASPEADLCAEKDWSGELLGWTEGFVIDSAGSPTVPTQPG